MANGFDVVAVRIQNERAVIVRMIVRANAWSAIVATACGDGRLVERVDEGSAGNAKRDVDRRNVGFSRHCGR
jgi:hypothetical protein